MKSLVSPVSATTCKAKAQSNVFGQNDSLAHMPRLLFLCLFACFVATECRAEVTYKFSYTAQSGPVRSFSFSFTAPTFVTDGSSPTFTPFTLTDGTNSWTMTKDLVAVEDPTGLNRGASNSEHPLRD
jgi:hypothetical protein